MRRGDVPCSVFALLLAFSMVSVVGSAGAPGGATPLQDPVVYVDALGGCQGNTPCESGISAGVQRVDPDGLVIVYGFGGSYFESVVIPKPLTLRGEAPTSVVVDGSFGGFAIDVQSDGVTVENFTLTGSLAGAVVNGVQNVILRDLIVQQVDRGLLIRSAGLTVERVTIQNTLGAGVDVAGPGPVVLDTITVSGASPGIIAIATDGLRVMNSAFLQSSGAGIDVRGSLNPRIEGNNVSENFGLGMWVNGSGNVIVRGNQFWFNALTGLNLSASVDVAVEGNVFGGNGALGFGPPGPIPQPWQAAGGGLWFWEVDPVLVTANTVEANYYSGIGIGGTQSADFTLSGNMVRDNGGPGLVLTQGPSRIDVDGDFLSNRGDAILMGNASFVTIHDARLEGNLGYGIRANQSFSVQVRDSTVARNGGSNGGLWFWEVDPSEVRDTTIVDNLGPGVTLAGTTDFNLIGNTIERNQVAGVLLQGVTRTRLSANRIADNADAPGVLVSGSTEVRVDANTFEANLVGVSAQGSTLLRVHRNNFLSNVFLQAEDDAGAANAWDDGYPNGGNFWSDYTGVDRFGGPNQDQPGPDGLGDTPYPIDADSEDRYPLSDLYPGNVPPTCALLTPTAGTTLTGGDPYTISWTMDDDLGARSLLVYLNWTAATGGGAIAGPLLGGNATTWMVPEIDVMDAVVRLTVIDVEDGRCEVQGGPFTIDSTAPIADAGGPYTADVGVPVAFDGSASSDAGGIVNWTWTITGPSGTIVLYGAQPSRAFSTAGTHSVTLVVTDGAGHSATDTATLTVTGGALVTELWPWLVVAVAAVLILVVSLFLWLGGRRKPEPDDLPPPPPEG